MPEPIFNPQEASQPDWRTLVQEAEERINVLSAALDDMRSVVRDLAFLALQSPAEVMDAPAAPPVRTAEPSAAAGHDSLSAATWPQRFTETPTIEGPPSPPPHHEIPRADPVAFSGMMRDDGWGAPSLRVEEAQPESDSTADEREVRRAVEQARAELETSWIAEDEASQDGASAAAAQGESQAEDDYDAREAVRRAVEQARAELESDQAAPSGSLWPESASVAQSDATEVDASSNDARDEVRRAVEKARAELESSSAAPAGALWPAEQSGWPSRAPANESEQPEDSNEHETVRRAVEEARADMEAGMLRLSEMDVDALSEAGPSYEEREDVRRKVALAKAELELSAINPDGEAPDLMQAMPARRASWEAPTFDEAELMPPVMVIEDAERHVELARVYEVLNRLECTAHASLLNYAPHNVSIGLTSREVVPQQEAIRAAVKAVFGRGCQIVAEGSRLSINIGDNQGRAA
ncbi:MAG: hypothetical protein GEU75_03325 [Dehalococcoidia bacterium]|nr:hypothetical protein [Dehalococcoidia bacterium]